MSRCVCVLGALTDERPPKKERRGREETTTTRLPRGRALRGDPGRGPCGRRGETRSRCRAVSNRTHRTMQNKSPLVESHPLAATLTTDAGKAQRGVARKNTRRPIGGHRPRRTQSALTPYSPTPRSIVVFFLVVVVVGRRERSCASLGAMTKREVRRPSNTGTGHHRARCCGRRHSLVCATRRSPICLPPRHWDRFPLASSNENRSAQENVRVRPYTRRFGHNNVTHTRARRHSGVE